MRPFRTPAVHRPERLEHLFSPYDEPIHHWTSTPVQPRTGTLSTSRVSVPRVRTRGTLPWPGEQTVPAPRVTLTVRVWLASHPATPREGGWQDHALQSLYATSAAYRWFGRPVGLEICLPLWLEQARFDEMPTLWYGAVDVDVVRSEHYRLCDERESMTAQLHETYRLSSGTLLAAGDG